MSHSVTKKRHSNSEILVYKLLDAEEALYASLIIPNGVKDYVINIIVLKKVLWDMINLK